MKKIIYILIGLLLLPSISHAQLTLPQGGTGTTTVPKNWVVIGSSALRVTAVSTSSLGIFNYTNLGRDMILTTDSSGTVVASSTPTAAAYFATSTTATSTFAGGISGKFATLTSGLTVTGGNVGIGTAAPTHKLDVMGGFLTAGDSSSATANNQAFLQGGVTIAYVGALGTQRASFGNQENYETMTADGGNIGIASTTPYAQLSVTNTTANPSFIVEDSTSPDTTPFIIDASGNVGIGRSNPTALLQVKGDIIVSNNTSGYNGVIRGDNSNGGTGGAIQIGVDTTAANQYVAFGTTPSGAAGEATFTEKMRILGTGNVGIGTTTPGAKLDIVGVAASGPSTSDRGIFRVDANANAVGLSVGNYSASPYGMWLQSMDDRNGSATSYPIILNPLGGYVGIATTSPTAKFTVENGNSILSIGQYANYFASTTAANAQTINWNSGNNQRFILDNNTQFVINATSSNPIDGGHYLIKVCQPPAGGKTATFTTPGQLRWIGITPATTTIPTTANQCAFIGFVYDNLYKIYNVASTTGSLN